VSPGKPLATDCLPTSSRPKGSWLWGFDGLSAATQCSALSGNHRVTLTGYFFTLLPVPPSGGIVSTMMFWVSKSPGYLRPGFCSARGLFNYLYLVHFVTDLYFIDYVHTFGNVAKDGILPV